jgi:hypothetical protein
MALTLFVGGERWLWRAGSLQFEDQVSERSALRFVLTDEPNTLLLPKGTPVLLVDELEDRVDVKFSGVVERAKRTAKVNPDSVGAVSHDVQCIDGTYWVDKRIVSEGWEEVTPGQVVLDLLESPLREENVYAHPYPGTAVTLARSDLLGYWRLADGPGDESYRDHDGTDAGAPTYTGVGVDSPVGDTHLGGYVTLDPDGGDDFITTGLAAEDFEGSAFTVGAWVWSDPSNAASYTAAVSCASSGGFSGGSQDLLFALRRYPTGVGSLSSRWAFAVQQSGVGGTVYAAVDPTPDPDSTWLHYTGVFVDNGDSTGSVRLYADGVLVASNTTPFGAAGMNIPASNPPVTLGLMSGVFPLDGRLSEALITGRAMSGAEVATLHDTAGEAVRVDAGAPVIQAVALGYVDCAESFGELAELAGSDWFVDPYRTVHFHARGAACCTYATTITNTNMLGGSVSLDESSPKFRDRQFVRGGNDETTEQTETLVADGEQRSFAVGFPIVKAPAISVETGVATGVWTAQSIGIKGLEVGSDFYWSKGDAVVTQEDEQTPVAAGVRVRVTYIGQFPIVVVVAAEAERLALRDVEGSGTGYVDAVVDDATVQSRQQGFDVASAKLERYATAGRTMEWTTRDAGMRAGQLVMVDLPRLGFSEEVLVESVTEFDVGFEVRWTVKATSGPALLSWRQFFARAAKRQLQAVDRVNIGREEVTQLLEAFSETTTMSESTTAPVALSCPIVPFNVPANVC